jgi:FHA domain
MGQHHQLATRLALKGSVIALSQPAIALDSSAAFEAAGKTATLIEHAISQGYHVAPALMLGLAIIAAMPVVAFASRIAEWSRRGANATRRHRGRFEPDVSGGISGDGTEIENGLSARAFLEVVGSSGTRYAILRDMMRIGREDDNDIRIPSGAVHRYHAAIHREDLGDWHITDLSGVEGNGIAVNGQRCGDARLHDGDVIELGPGRLRFRAQYA